jgi:pentatricopeptide repeat domain-containing protein 2
MASNLGRFLTKGCTQTLALSRASGCFLQSSQNNQLNYCNLWRITGNARSLFTAEANGLDAYEKQRARSQTQFAGSVDKFRDKMREFVLSDNKEMIFTEDLKNMVHLIEARPDDLVLIHQMMKRFNKQNRNLRFGNFVFGPVVMRMYHHLGQPANALEVFKDPELEGFFDQLTSYQVLCDLLYRNAMYQDVLDVFEIIKKKQLQGQKFPRNVSILVFAACYKLNTPKSYEYALSVLTEMREFGVDPVRRSVAYASALALNQGAPQVALEIISGCRTSNYVTIRNLKLWALADLNRPEDCLPLLRYSIEFDSPEAIKRQSVFPEILEKVSTAIDRLGKKDVSLEFERIHKSLVDTKQIANQSFFELMEAEVESRPRVDQPEGPRDRSFRIGRSLDLQPRRAPVYQREFRERVRYE